MSGIWTKHLKAKTELHQTVIDRCLKSLVQKQLIKAVKGVKVCRRLPSLSYWTRILLHISKYPTRKIYMMAHLEPSVELTGGPWYTDNELDTEFIKLLSSVCLSFIRDRVSGRSPNTHMILMPEIFRVFLNKSARVIYRLLRDHCTRYLGRQHIQMHSRSSVF